MPKPEAPQWANVKSRCPASRSRLLRILMFPFRLAQRAIRAFWQLFRRFMVTPCIRLAKLARQTWHRFIVAPAVRLQKSGRQTSRRLVVTPVIRWSKRFTGSALVFEDIDVAMRRPLLQMRPDVIHAHDLMTLPTASVAASEIDAAVVYDSHELELHRNATYPKLAWMRRAWLEKRHIRRASLVITVSDSIANHLCKQYRIPRPEVILNAPPLAGTDYKVASIRGTLGLSPGTPLAIYVGAVTINRGLDVCVRALAHFPELHFATIGPRRKPTEEALIALAEAEGVDGRLHLVDPLPPDDVVSYIKDADVSLLAIQNVCLSYYYCMPNKLFESVLANVPVAVADLVELRRFVEQYPCGLVMDETDPVDIARAIRKICRNKDAYVLRGDDLEEVRANYSWPAQATRLVEAYSRLSNPALY